MLLHKHTAITMFVSAVFHLEAIDASEDCPPTSDCDCVDTVLPVMSSQQWWNAADTQQAALVELNLQEAKCRDIPGTRPWQ